MTETYDSFDLRFLLPRNTNLLLGGRYATEVFEGKRFGRSAVRLSASSQVTKSIGLSLSFLTGGKIRYVADPYQGRGSDASFAATILPSEKISFELRWTASNFVRASDGVREYDYTILRGLGSYQVNKYLFFRCVLEYNDYRKKLLGAQPTMIESTKPVISVCAVRTGSGKSQTSRRVAHLLQRQGLKVAAIRHPMPYGDLEKQKVQRYGSLADLKKHKCTIEEMEEYEPHIVEGIIIYAGVDYGAILEQAQAEADVILWDGGNNDMPFYKPDLAIVVADPLRVGNELSYYPAEANLRMKATWHLVNNPGRSCARRRMLKAVSGCCWAGWSLCPRWGLR